MMLTFDKDALVTSQYDGNIRRDASLHHSMMLTFDKDASVTSQYDINIGKYASVTSQYDGNIRQRCLSYITV